MEVGHQDSIFGVRSQRSSPFGLKTGTSLTAVTRRAMREATGNLESLYEFAVHQSIPHGHRSGDGSALSSSHPESRSARPGVEEDFLLEEPT